MDIQGEKKVSSVTVQHWKTKFDKAIRVLLNSGIKGEDLIEEIKKVVNEKNNKTQ